MGSDDLFKRAQNLRNLSDYRKRTAHKLEKQRILIVCEGEQTEPNYFNCFRPANIVVRGYGFNTDSLVNKAIDVRKKDDMGFDQVWCVFDRDDFPPWNVNEAFRLARTNNIKIAYSNESFELWFCLHFHYIDAALDRNQYCDITDTNLKSLNGKEYSKNMCGIYNSLLPFQDAAIRNAQKLFEKYADWNPLDSNPSTTVHNLVIELNKWL
jgi:hypothetical protein